MIMSDECIQIWGKLIMVYLKVSGYSPGQTEENNENPQDSL
jgi:hypothetical protein